MGGWDTFTLVGIDGRMCAKIVRGCARWHIYVLDTYIIPYEYVVSVSRFPGRCWLIFAHRTLVFLEVSLVSFGYRSSAYIAPVYFKSCKYHTPSTRDTRCVGAVCGAI